MFCIEDRLAAYQFDCAVTMFRIIVENALQETVEVGSDKYKRRVPRWSLREILDDKFKLPRDNAETGKVDTLEGVDGAYFDEV